MAGFRAAHRYAKGLMEFANEANQTDVVYAEMNDVRKVIKENDDLRVFLNSPVIDAKKKEAVLSEIFKSLSKTSQTFISLVVRHGRENILSKIADQFISLYDLANNIVTAEITSAVQLDQNTIDNIVISFLAPLSISTTLSTACTTTLFTGIMFIIFCTVFICLCN